MPTIYKAICTYTNGRSIEEIKSDLCPSDISLTTGDKDKAEARADRDEEFYRKKGTYDEMTIVVIEEEVMPEVGDDCTINFVSDRHPARVIGRSASGKTIKVARIEHTRVAGSEHDGSAEYEYGEVIPGAYEFYTWRSNGYFVRKGETARHGTSLTLGIARRYYDPHF